MMAAVATHVEKEAALSWSPSFCDGVRCVPPEIVLG
jgi:hypothetical protein